MVKGSADSLLSLLNDILDLSKIEAGKLDFETIDFNLRDTLEDAIKGLSLRAHQKGIELACHLPSDVPEAVQGDPTRLRQVVVNLVGNAIKFTATGEVVLRVDRGEAAEDDALLHFRGDTGRRAVRQTARLSSKRSLRQTALPPENTAARPGPQHLLAAG